MNGTGNRFPRHSAMGGFTMIEVILTITIAAILGTIAIQFSGTSLSMSGETVDRIKKSYAISEIMEMITRDYRVWVEANPGQPISKFETQIQTDSQYINYISDTATGTGSSYFVDPTGDQTIDLLHLTLTDPDGTQSLVALFTK